MSRLNNMQRHRVFIAINLPEDVKKKLVEYQKKWPELPVRWTKPDNLHITLEFLGYVRDENLINVFETTEKMAKKHKAFDVKLSKICYGPQNKKPPRMVWAVGERSEEFTSLKNDLDKALSISENREFSPHITLGRIRQWDWRRVEPEERPEIDEDVNLNFSVDSIEIMESQLKRGGAEYTILETVPLGQGV